MTATMTEASPRAPRPTSDEMTERAEAVLALLPEHDSTITSLDIGAALHLTVPQTDTLVTKMLKAGQLGVVGYRDKRRVLAKSHPQALRPVSTRDFISHLQLGQSLQVMALRLDEDGRPVVEVAAPGSGVAVLTTA